MADKNIGLLPKAPDLYDDSLMVVEQQGAAMSLTGLQFKQFAQTSVKQYVQDAKDAAASAAQSAQTAKEYSGNPPDIINEQWWIWDATLKAYVNTGEPTRGDDGTVLRALYPTYADLIAAHPTGNLGDAYAVGDPTDWTAYIWDVDHQTWSEIGQLGGGMVNPTDGSSKSGFIVVGTSTAGHTSADCDYLCDGTDDNEEIQSAINEADQKGFGVLLLGGTYNISNSISFLSTTVNMRGVSKTATTLNWVGTVDTNNSTWVFIVNDVNVKISELGFSFEQTLTSADGYNYALAIDGPSAVVEDCIFYICPNAIFCDNVNGIVRNCTIYGGDNTVGIYMLTGNIYNNFIGSLASSITGFVPIHTVGNGFITGNRIEGDGIKNEGSATIFNNIINGVHDVGAVQTYETEEWTFTLSDGSTVTKEVVLAP